MKEIGKDNLHLAIRDLQNSKKTNKRTWKVNRIKGSDDRSAIINWLISDTAEIFLHCIDDAVLALSGECISNCARTQDLMRV